MAAVKTKPLVVPSKTGATGADIQSTTTTTKISTNGNAAQVVTPSAASAAEVRFATGRVILLGAALLTIGTLGFYNLPGMIIVDENEDNKNRNHLVDSFYCAAITLTTVGFGDICPGETNFVGKVFLVLFSWASLGIFCGPVMDLASSWRSQIPGGLPALASFILGVGVLVFSTLEGLEQTDAIYASVVTGTTIGYGDTPPRSNIGKIGVALYAIASVNAMAILLEPAREYFEAFCRAKTKQD